MNLVIFTPAAKTSAIGRMAALVTQSLANLEHKITVIRTEDESLLATETHRFGAQIIPWTDTTNVMSVAQAADSFIYHIGDNYLFHKGAVHSLPKFPGLVCLHDFFVADLFNSWAQSSREKADKVLRAWYGDEVASKYFHFASTASFIEDTRDVAPLTEWICSMAQGIITHSNWGCERVIKSCSGPIRVVPLAYDAPGASLASSPVTSESKTKMKLLTIGHVNPNRRIESVIEAIGNCPLLKENVIYRLVGAITQEVSDVLTKKALEHDVKLVISGQVSDTDLAQAISESDVISCLRWPSLEAASASAIEALLYGKPVLVTDTAFYSELPNELVMKICPDNEIADIQDKLQKLLADRNLRFELGTNGQRWAMQTFTADNYAKETVIILEEIMKSRPILDAITFYSSLLYKWSGGDVNLNYNELTKPLRLFEDFPE